MSYNLVRSHRLYITSENRDPNDTPYNFKIEIPNNLIGLDDPATQRMKISLMNFTCDCMWFEVNARNNGVLFNNNSTDTSTPILIPEGNYTFDKLAYTITDLYPECLCEWISETNKFRFTFTEDHSISFVGSSYTILGFTEDDDGIDGVTIVSSQPLQVRANNMLYIRLNDVIHANDCISLDNLTSPHAKPSDILATVPVNAMPFQTIFYDNTLYGRDMGLFLSNPKLNSINISVTDKYGNYLDYLTDWDMQLLVEIYNVEDDALVDMQSSLHRIDNTLNRLLIYKFIR